MKILFLSRWFPFPANNGSKIRIYNLLCSLAQEHQTSLISFVEDENDNAISKMASICTAITTVPWQEFKPNSLKAQLGFFSVTPRSIVDTYSLEMQNQIEQALLNDNFDLIIASQWHMASYYQSFKDVPALFEEVEIGLHYQFYTQATAIKPRVRFGLSWLKHKQYIANLLKNFQASTVVSIQEKELLAQISSDHQIEVFPNCIDLNKYQNKTTKINPNTIIFTGPFSYHANYEAMIWFLEKVYPKVLAQIPNTELIITGDHLGKPLPSMKNVNLVGFVDDIQALIASSCVSIVPLQVGGGTRLKILEAMALSTPVVSTSKGSEGIECQPGMDILIADDPDLFAKEVVRLLQDAELRKKLTENAYQIVEDKYNWPIVSSQFLHFIETLVD